MRMRIADTTLYCEITGHGPPILFVHGFPISGEMWRPTVERLGGGWRCIVPDLRGHGRSEVSETVTIAQFAEDLAELLDVLDERRPAVLVGLSMGGIIAFEFFRRYGMKTGTGSAPNPLESDTSAILRGACPRFQRTPRPRLRALVLCNTRANAETPEGVVRREAVAQTALRDGTRAVVDGMKGLFGPAFSPAQRDYWTNLMAQTPAQGAAAASRAMGSRAESFSTLPKIDCPTLVVAGEHDTFTPVETLREIHRGIPGARLEIIPDAGHVPPAEQPDRFTAVLREFLGGLE